MPSCLSRVPSFAILLPCLLFAGCQEEGTVESYSVERTAAPRPPMDAEAVLEQLDHILVAIVPQDDKVWFFKLVGKAPAIGRQRDAFNKFLSTVKLAESSADTPSWELPESWQEKKASAMRVATLVVPDDEGKLEVAVSSLPLTVEWEEFLVPNVNRWLNQLQQQRLPLATILKLAKKIPTSEGDATVFELSGMMSQRPMGGMGGNPHAGLGIAAPSTPSQKPVDTPVAPPAAASKGLTYQTPEGWLPGRMSMMRKAAFLLPDGGASDEVTVTSFPAGVGQMSDVDANVQRWAGQVGMARPTGESLGKLTESIKVDGVEGTYVELVSPEGAARPVALYVAMIEREGQVWFFKMIGGSELLAAQRDAFREFLGSVKFP